MDGLQFFRGYDNDGAGILVVPSLGVEAFDDSQNIQLGVEYPCLGVDTLDDTRSIHYTVKRVLAKARVTMDGFKLKQRWKITCKNVPKCLVEIQWIR